MSKRVYGTDYGKLLSDSHVKVDFAKLRRDRLERARAQMKKDGIGALLLFSHYNVRYVTGFRGPLYSRTAPRYYALLPRNGDPYLWGVGGHIHTFNDQMPWLKGNIRLSMGAVEWMIRDPEAYGGGFIKEVADILAEHGILNEPLGIDGPPSFSILKMADACKKNGILNLADGQSTMLEARKIKTEEEIELLEISAAIAESAFAEARDVIRPGITENELAGVLLKKLLTMGAEWVNDLVICFGETTNPNRRAFGDRILRPGDMGMIDIAGSEFCGYRTCYYRTFTVGRASQEQKDLYQSAYQMLYDGMSAVKAGNTTLDVVNKWPGPEHWGWDNEYIAYENKMGHGIGLTQHDPPMIITSIARANPVVLEEDMVIALEVYEGKRGGKEGCKVEEEIVVTKDGYDLLTHWPVKEITECWI